MSEDGDNMEHFDPNADPKERRRLRYEYRELIAETQSKRIIFVLYLVFRWQFMVISIPFPIPLPDHVRKTTPWPVTFHCENFVKIQSF